MLRLLAALLLLACAAPASALRVQLSVGSIEHPALPAPLTDLRFDCRIVHDARRVSCRKGELRAQLRGQPMVLRFDASLQRNGAWRLDGQISARGWTWSEPTGRYATDKLDLDLRAKLDGNHRQIRAEIDLGLPAGQAYAEPVFLDFGAAPATLLARLTYGLADGQLDVAHFDLKQRGVMQASGSIRRPDRTAPAQIAADLAEVQIAPTFASYVQPFLAGSRLEKVQLTGRARGHIESRGADLQRLALELEDIGVESESYDAGLRQIEGRLNWQAQAGEGDASDLRWAGGHIAKLELGATDLKLRASARDVQLLAPMRLPLAGGALNVHELAIQRAGRPDIAARFDAHVEPIDLATLCRAFGWPEFGGQLGGRLPGLSLQEGELKLDGALTAKAFDGDVALDGLRVLDPFGRVPRVEGDIRLRNLDLAAITGAFSFGRIEGRLDGDVENLRLLNWKPISFRARLATPPGDRSRHRISQRAIDNISAVGGGPTGLLKRGALRFFEDFAYERIGWSCILSGGVCSMDGIEPAKGGGYVLVKGRLVPRIDVVGFSRQVDWDTFVSQLGNARGAQGIQVR
ncbi:MAG: hypothetical protein ACREUE_05260 [Panacagrimonas sp.]